MHFSTISNEFRAVLVGVLILFNTIPDAHAQGQPIVSIEDYEPVVRIDAKVAWNMCWMFVGEEAGKFFLIKAYHIYTSRKTGTVYVSAANVSFNPNRPNALRNAYSRDELFELSLSDKHMKTIMEQICPVFFKLSNQEKMIALDNYLESHFSIYR